jgi:transcriptional regulator with AAA-type ATPase domain
MEILMHYDFPGNIRELKNIIARAIALTDQSRIQVIDLPPDLQKLDFKTFETLEMETLEEMEKRYITTILQRTKVISNKEYPEVEGCSQTVPVWSGCSAWSGTTDVWLLHDGILIAGNHPITTAI